MSSIMLAVYNKSRQVATFEMGLGSNFFEKVVVPYANSPLTNPLQIYDIFFQISKYICRRIPKVADAVLCRGYID